MKKIFLILLVFSFFCHVDAQKENPSSFNSVTITYKAHPKFFLFVEGQLRGIEDYSYPDYYEIKGGIGYNLTKNHKPFIGIGRYGNYKNQKFDKEEFRFWLQDVVDVKLGKFKLENRFRAEKSWFFEPQKDVHSQRTRLRYRLNVSIPLNSETVKPGTVFANVFEEVFFITTEGPLFSRNRFYSGFGYQINENFGIASGYVWQREFTSSGNKNIHSIYLALNITINGGEKNSYEFPGAD